MKRKKIGVAAVVATMLALTACSQDGYTDQSMQSLRYEAGATQGGDFVECMEPGKKINTNDRIYAYPVSQRADVWDSNQYHKGSNSADHGDLELTDKDGNSVFYKIKVPFFLNTDCSPVTVNGKEYPGGTLQVFHELLSKTRHGYFDVDGTYGGEDSGWIWLMDNHISSSVIDIMNTFTRSTSVDKLWKDADELAAAEATLQEKLQEAVNASTETDLQFYKIGQVSIFQASPDQDYLALFKDRQRAQINADTAEENRLARIKEAKADTDVAIERGKELRAEIDAAGGPQWYWCGKAIEAGQPCFQPNGTVMVGR